MMKTDFHQQLWGLIYSNRTVSLFQRFNHYFYWGEYIKPIPLMIFLCTNLY